MINKSKKNDIEFVETLSIEVIKQLLDRFDSEDGWFNVIKVLHNNENQKKLQLSNFLVRIKEMWQL